MATTNEVTKIHETILSIPGMNETVQVPVKIFKKMALLPDHVVTKGLEKDNMKKSAFIKSFSDGNPQDLVGVMNHFLSSAKLPELKGKLKLL